MAFHVPRPGAPSRPPEASPAMRIWETDTLRPGRFPKVPQLGHSSRLLLGRSLSSRGALSRLGTMARSASEPCAAIQWVLTLQGLGLMDAVSPRMTGLPVMPRTTLDSGRAPRLMCR